MIPESIVGKASQALALANQIQLLQEELEGLKTFLREEVRPFLQRGTQSVSIPCQGGVVQVTFPKDKPVLPLEGPALKESMGDLYPLLVEEVTSYRLRKDWKDTLSDLRDHPSYNGALGSISFEAQTVRVGFRPSDK